MTIEDMITEVMDWGLKPKTVTTDAWYASKENLKFLRNKDLGFLVGVARIAHVQSMVLKHLKQKLDLNTHNHDYVNA